MSTGQVVASGNSLQTAHGARFRYKVLVKIHPEENT